MGVNLWRKLRKLTKPKSIRANRRRIPLACELLEHRELLTTYYNFNGITIPASGTGPGASNPLYSEINVSGRSGTIDFVEVDFVNLSHTYPDDLDIYFGSVATGHILIMSDCGGTNDLVNARLNFRPTSTATGAITTSLLPDSSQIVSSTSIYYRGTNYDTDEGTGYLSDLSYFNGLSPNQTWRIDARDDSAGDSGSMQSWYLILSTTPYNVSAGGSYSITEGNSVSLTSSASDDDGQSLNYSWDLNGNGVYGDATGQSPTVSWSTLQSYGINDNGPHTIGLRVSDGYGYSYSSATLTVSNAAPTGTISNNGPVNKGSPVTVSLSGSDASSVDAGSLRYSFATSTGGLASSYSGASTSSSGTFTYANNGTYTAYGRVYDKDGGISPTYSTTITVQNATPVVIAPSSQNANEGTATTFNLGSFTDPGPDTPWTATVLWGDSSSDSFTVNSPGSLGTRSHTYADNGFYTATVKVKDKDNAEGSASFYVNVLNVAPTGTLTNNGPVSKGSPVTVSLSGSDLSSVDASSLHYSFATTANGLAQGYSPYGNDPGAGTASSATFTFPDDGTYTIYGRVYDKDQGISPTYSTTITVANLPPAITAPAYQNSNEGTAASFDLGSFTDAAGGSPWTVTVLWGDNTSDSFTVNSTGVLGTRSHLYADNGTYPVTVKVKDKDNAEGSAGFQIGVANVAPTATFSNTGPVNEGDPVIVRFTAAADASSADQGSLHYFFSTSPIGQDVSYAGSGTVTEKTFTFDQAGSYTVYGEVIDKDGWYTDYQTTVTVIRISDTWPTVGFAAPSSSGSEAVSPAGIVVSLSAASNDTITVAYRVTGGTATGGGADYSLPSGTLTFDAGTTTRTLSLVVIDDSAYEPAETVQIALSVPTYAKLGAQTTHTYTILDNDAPASNSVTATVVSGLLLVDGTAAADAINIHQTSANIEVYDASRLVGSFAVAGLAGVEVSAKEGDDVVDLRGSGMPLSLPATVFAGSGQNTLYGGAGPVELNGGTGDAVHALLTFQAPQGNITLGGFSLLAPKVTISDSGVGLEGDASLPLLGNIHLLGTYQDSSHYSINAHLASATITGFTLTNADATLSNSGLGLMADANFPLIGAVHVMGSIQDASHYSLSAALPNITIAGFSVNGAKVTLSDSGLNLAGKANLPLVGSVDLSEPLQDATAYSLTAPIPTLTLSGYALTNGRITLSSSGLDFAGDATLPLVGGVHLTGSIQDASHYSFTVPIPSVSVGAFSLTNNRVTFSDAGVSLEGDANIPVISKAVRLLGALQDADHISLTVPLPDVSIGAFHLSDNNITLSKTGVAITGHSKLAVLGNVTFTGSIAADGTFAISAAPQPFSVLGGLVQFDQTNVTLTTDAVTVVASATVAKLGQAKFEGSIHADGSYSLKAKASINIAGGFKIDGADLSLGSNELGANFTLPVPAIGDVSFGGSYGPGGQWSVSGTYPLPVTVGPVVLKNITVRVSDKSLLVGAMGTVADLEQLVNAKVTAEVFFDGRFEAKMDIHVVQVAGFSLGQANVTFGNNNPSRLFILTIDAVAGISAAGLTVNLKGYLDARGYYELSGKQTIKVAGLTLSQAQFELKKGKGFTFSTDWVYTIFTVHASGTISNNGRVQFHGDGTGKLAGFTLGQVHVDADLNPAIKTFTIDVGARINLIFTEANLNAKLTLKAGNWSPFKLEGPKNLPSPLSALFPGTVSLIVDKDGARFDASFKSSYVPLAFNVHAAVNSDGSLKVNGDAKLPVLGTVTLAGSISRNGNFSLTASNVSKPIGKFSFPSLSITLSNNGLAVSGSATLPLLDKISLKGSISSNGDFSLTASNVSKKIGGFSFPSLSITLSNSGLQVSGSSSLPVLGSVSLSGSISSNGNFSLTVSNVSKTIAGFSLPSLSITLSNSGLSVSGSASLPVLGSVSLKGSVSSNGSFSLTASNVSKSIGGFSFPRLSITLSNSGLEVSGSSSLPVLGSISLSGSISSDGSFSLTASNVSRSIAGFSFPSVSITVSNSGLQISGSASLPVLGSISLSGAIYSDGNFSFTGSLNSALLAGASLAEVTMNNSGVVISAWLPFIGNVGLTLYSDRLGISVNVGVGLFSVRTVYLYTDGHFDVEASAPVVGTIWISGPSLSNLASALSDKLPKVNIDGPKVGGALGKAGNAISTGFKKAKKFFSISTGAIVFFDTNKNGVLDSTGAVQQPGSLNEPWTYINYLGEYLLEVPEEFDKNGNGLLDDDDGQWIIVGGKYTATGLPANMIGMSPGSWNMVTPLTTLVASLANSHSLTVSEAATAVLRGMGLPAVDLAKFDVLAEIRSGNPAAALIYRAHARIVDSIAQVTALYASPAGATAEELSRVVVAAIADQILASPTALNFNDSSFIANLVRTVGTRIGRVLADDLVNGAAAVLAATNQQLDASEPAPETEYIHGIEQIKLVSQGAVAQALGKAAKGELDITAVVQANTGDALVAQIVAAVIPPTLLVPDVLVVEATNSQGAPADLPVVANDLLGQALPVTLSQASGSIFGIGDTIVTASTTDTSGNSVSANFTVRVVDTKPPAFTLPAELVVEATRPEGAMIQFPANAVADLVDPHPVVTYDVSAGVFGLGATRVTATATDASRNTSHLTFTVRVVDTTPPELSVPANVVAEATQTGGAVVSLPDATATDLVDTSPQVIQTYSSGFFPLGTTLVTVTAIDSSGNASVKTYTVTVRDTVPPEITVSDELVVEANMSGGASVGTMQLTVADVADPDPSVTYNLAFLPLGTTQVTATATDASGNSSSRSFTVTVVDTTPPTITLPDELIVEADQPGGATVAFSDLQVTDLADPNPLVTYDVSPGFFPLGTTLVTVTATDASGNSSSFTVTVTVEDTTPPVLTDLADMVVAADDSGGAVVTLPDIQATDVADPNPVVNYDSPSGLFPVGTTLVTATATDASGNISAFRFAVIVVDSASTMPVLAALAHIGGIREEGASITITGQAISRETLHTATDVTFSWAAYKGETPTPFATSSGVDETSFTFTPDDEGTYRVMLTVAAAGGVHSTEETTILVENGAPQVELSNHRQGATIYLTALVQDPSPVDNQAGFTYDWNITKDGSSFAAGTNRDGGFSFAPDTDGIYVIDLTVTDKDGGITTVEQTIPVVAHVALDGNFETNEDMPVSGQVTATDGNTLTYSLVDGPSAGTVIVNPDGTFVYTPNTDYYGEDSFTFLGSDGTANTNTASISLTVHAMNDAPVTQASGLTVDEDATVTGTLPATDVDGDDLTYSLVDTTNAHGILIITDASTGAYTYTPNLNYNGPASFTFRVSDGQINGNPATISIMITPVNDPATARAGLDQTVDQGDRVDFDGTSSFDLDGDAFDYLWNFGDGNTGSGPTPSHIYAASGIYTLTLTVTDLFGASSTDSLTVTVNYVEPPTLAAGRPIPISDGFTLQFNQNLDVGVLNLYDQGGSFGSADVTVVGAATGPVRGSLIVQNNPSQITFVRTGGRLLPDTYTITFRSGSNGFISPGGKALDGNGDGNGGDNFVTTFTVVAPPANAVTVSVPDFIRGSGQMVNLPASATGIPITLSTGQNVSRVDFRLHYNSALLTITGLVPGSLPTGAEASVTTSAGETIVSVYTTGGAFASTAGPITLIRLAARVPSNALYGAKEILDLTNLVVRDTNANDLPALDDDGIQVVAFVGDLNGDHRYDARDAILLQRVMSGQNTGFGAYALLDPALLADVNANGQLQTNDVRNIQRAIVHTAATNIPSLPVGLPVSTSTALDPHLFLPQDLASLPGETVTLPVMLEVTEPIGITVGSAQVVVGYDADRFSVSNLRLGSLLTGFAASFDTHAPGTLLLTAHSASGTDHLPFGLTGSLFLIDLTVKPDALPGSSPLNLRAATALFDNNLQELLLLPVPTDAWTDQVDGLFTILGQEDKRSRANPLFGTESESYDSF